jgi:predicted SAM-dependent methyltransferase
MRRGRVKYATAQGLRLMAGSVDGFYASHVLEHMSRTQCVNLLRRVRVWLKSTGLLRVVLPDLRMFAVDYVERRIDANRFVELSGLAVDAQRASRIIFGHTHHRWMYDAESAAQILKSLGYTNVRRCECGDTALDEFAALDHGVGRACQSFYLEAAR